MLNLFTDELRRDPYSMYDQMRAHSPVLEVPPPFDMWAVFDYDSVKSILSDHDNFLSSVPAPREWFNFFDPPRHTRRRALIAKAFTPRIITNLQPRIAELSRCLLNKCVGRGEMDLAAEYAVPLPMMVIAEMIGIPRDDWARFRRWSDVILKLSYTMRGIDEDESRGAVDDFASVTAEMSGYLADMIRSRLTHPAEDLLSTLVNSEIDGERLTHEEILGFFQLLIVGGQETTANLINNAILSLLENPLQLARLRQRMELLSSTIEEVLRFRSPVQWLMRKPKRNVQLNGHTIPEGKLILVMLGSANRDPKHFHNPDQFDITRDPNPHLAFGHGIHFCLGAALSRMEARIALTDLLGRLQELRFASDRPWEPRKALHVHGPSSLCVQFKPAEQLASVSSPHRSQYAA